MGRDAASSSDGTSNTSKFAGCPTASFAAFLRIVDDVVRAADGLDMACGTVPGVVARDVSFDDVLNRCSGCPLPLTSLWLAVLCDVLAVDLMLAGCILAGVSFPCVGL